MSRYVDIEITRQAKPVSEASFGTMLILGTQKTAAYKVYKNEELGVIKTDFGEFSEEYKVAKAHFEQESKPSQVAILGILYDNAVDNPSVLTVALDNLIKTNNDFYYLAVLNKEMRKLLL